jgi:hypothetical protein
VLVHPQHLRLASPPGEGEWEKGADLGIGFGGGGRGMEESGGKLGDWGRTLAPGQRREEGYEVFAER